MVGGGRKKLSSPHDLARPLHKEIIMIAVSLWGKRLGPFQPIWGGALTLHPPPPNPLFFEALM